MSLPHTLWDYTGLSVTRIQLPVMSLSLQSSSPCVEVTNGCVLTNPGTQCQQAFGSTVWRVRCPTDEAERVCVV